MGARQLGLGETCRPAHEFTNLPMRVALDLEEPDHGPGCRGEQTQCLGRIEPQFRSGRIDAPITALNTAYSPRSRLYFTRGRMPVPGGAEMAKALVDGDPFYPPRKGLFLADSVEFPDHFDRSFLHPVQNLVGLHISTPGSRQDGRLDIAV
jgi:hypothetical protein